jgi:hypothetical protein
MADKFKMGLSLRKGCARHSYSLSATPVTQPLKAHCDAMSVRASKNNMSHCLMFDFLFTPLCILVHSGNMLPAYSLETE